MRFFAVLLTMSVGLGCAATNSRAPRSPDDENNEDEEAAEPQSEESAGRDQAETDDGGDDRSADEEARPVRKRKPKRRRVVSAQPEEELPPMYAKPLPPDPTPPPAEEPAPAPAYADGTDQGGNALEAEARKRCHWKNVAPYRPEWASSITPPLAQRRKITSKPICPYGTPPAVLHVARQIAVQQTKLKK